MGRIHNFNKVHKSVGPAAGLTRTKVLQSIWIRRYGVGKVCGGLLGEETSSTGTEEGLSGRDGFLKPRVVELGISKLDSEYNIFAVLVQSGGLVFMVGDGGEKWFLQAPLFMVEFPWEPCLCPDRL